MCWSEKGDRKILLAENMKEILVKAVEQEEKL